MIYAANDESFGQQHGYNRAVDLRVSHTGRRRTKVGELKGRGQAIEQHHHWLVLGQVAPGMDAQLQSLRVDERGSGRGRELGRLTAALHDPAKPGGLCLLPGSRDPPIAGVSAVLG